MIKNKPISIYKGGSSVILSNPKDEDIFYYYKDKYDLNMGIIKNHDHSKDFHFILIKNAKTPYFYGAYLYKYMELLEGQDLDLNSFDICDHSKEYANYLLYYCKWLKDKKGLTHKHWYHAYLGYNALKNGNGKKFTKTQIEKAQEIHDKGISKTLMQNIIDYLTNIVNN